MSEKKVVLEDWNAVKVITSLLVVLGHATHFYTKNSSIPPLEGSYVLDLLTKYIYSFHMPAFMAVSGAIFYYTKRNLRKYDDQVIFIRSKIKRLIIPYLFFAFFIVTPLVFYMGLIDVDPIKYFFIDFVLGKYPRYLWYVISLFNIFIIFNFIEKYVYNNQIISLIVLFFLCTISSILPSYFSINVSFYYLFYFYLGYLFQHNKNYMINVLEKRSFVIFLLLSYSLAFIFTVLINNDGVINKLMLKLMLIISSILGSLILYYISYLCSKSKIANNTFYSIISKDSYGLYLFHPMIIYLVYYYTRYIYINPFILVFIASILGLLLSLILIRLFRFLNFYILIGESKPKK